MNGWLHKERPAQHCTLRLILHRTNTKQRGRTTAKTERKHSSHLNFYSFDIFYIWTMLQKKNLKIEQVIVPNIFILLSRQDLEQSVQSFKLRSIATETLGNCSVRNAFLCCFYSAESSWSWLQTGTFLLGELTKTHIRARKPGGIEQLQSHTWRILKNKINRYPLLKVSSQNSL